MKRALITGVTGQDGAYLARHLLDDGYTVFGTFRRSSTPNVWRLQELDVESHERFTLIEGDLTDATSCVRLLDRHEPDEIYNLAAQSFVGVSFEQPITTAQITGVGALNMLEAVRAVNTKIRFYQASTSEMFGKVLENPQSEKTPFYPRSPYGVAKLFAHWSTVNYRETYGIFASSGILFNHESPLRSKEFVTRKITHKVAQISLGLADVLELGNLCASRDWGYAKDYVVGMHAMLQATEPDDFVLATGKSCTVREFVEAAFRAVGMQITWAGADAEEHGIDAGSGRIVVRVSEKFFRPCEVEYLCGDASLARDVLGWSSSTNVDELCKLMVETDIARVQRGYPF